MAKQEEAVTLIKVRAFPAPGNAYRRRCGKAFTEDWTELKVVKKPTEKLAADEVTSLQVAELEQDRRLTVVPAGMDEAVELEKSKAIATINAELEKKHKELSEAHELADEYKRAGEKSALEAAAKIRELEGQLEQARADLAKRTK